MRYDVVLISAGVLCMLAGEAIGVWMGVAHDFTLAPAHAHLNLLGWVTLCLYGLAHRAYPALSTSRLAMPQAVVAIAFAFLFPAGVAYAVIANNPLPAIIGSFGIMLGTLLFGVMFIGRAKAAA